MGRYMGESWDGFDGRAQAYDEKEEKKWHSGIWKLIACLSALMIIYIFVNHMKDLLLVQQGICIEAEYDETKNLARYVDENGQVYVYSDLYNYDFKSEDGHLKLYYRYNIHAARPRNVLMSYVKYYVFFGILFGISAWKIWKIYKH